ncbi:MAG: FHA domain-containing protein [Bacteroidetes bacterium]|nr:MAG: FHA domain-containing protein [Bacteroidota bacterium]
MMKSSRQNNPDVPPINVAISYKGKERVAGPFVEAFVLGRDDACDISIPSRVMSRKHARISFEKSAWWIIDLESSNGTFFDGSRIDRLQISAGEPFILAKDGPEVRFDFAALDDPDSIARAKTVVHSPVSEEKLSSAATPEPPSTDSGRRNLAGKSVEDYAAHYLSHDSGLPAGEHTMMIRKAFQTVETKQKKRHFTVLGGVLGVAVLIISVSLIFLFQSEKARKNAEASVAALFHQIKEMELIVADFRAANENDPAQQARIARAEEQIRNLQASYEATIVEYGIRRELTPEERLIHRMAMVFRESELEIPSGFVREVKQKIHGFWLQPRNIRTFQESVRRAEREGYTRIIVEQFQANGLPAEYFYLALQESNLDPTQVAYENTRWGWAKGMWQFIPATAERYDMVVGPLRDEKIYDPDDERHDFEKSTVAAAKYIGEIYRTLAQASGLLVLASYNWGEFGVARKLEALPDPEPFEGMEMNPVSRSYWRFYTEYQDRMPEQTKDYVLKIFSLAVIGSDPKFFGIEMEDPLSAYR